MLGNDIVRLQQNDPTLTKLDLSSQKIGDREARVLAKALAQNTTLLVLELSENQIGNAGAYALADALKVNSSLSTLRLSRNKIGGAGVCALADMLKVNRSLTILEIDKASEKLLDNINSLLWRNLQFAPQLKQANQSCRDGQAHLAAQRYPEARQCFVRTLKIYPEHPAAQARLNKIPTSHTLAPLQQNKPTLTQPSSVLVANVDTKLAFSPLVATELE